MLRKLVLFVALISVVTGKAESPSPRWEALPSSWYQLPEDGPVSPETRETDAMGKKQLFRALDEIFTADSEAFEQIDPMVGATAPVGEFPNMTKWHIGALMGELAISAKGIIAPVALKGTATVGVIWRKKNPPKPPAYPQDETERKDGALTALDLNENTTREEMQSQLEPMINIALATKKVKNEANFREELVEAANTFYDLSRNIQNGADARWWVSRFRVDVLFNISGKVSATVNVGAEFRIRFEWHRLKLTDERVANNEPRSELGAKFRQFVTELSEDAHDVSYETFNRTGFYPNYLRLGIGFSATGNFGVVKFGGGLTGYLYFNAASPKADRTQPVATHQGPLSPLNVIENDPSEKHLAFARDNGVPYEVSATDKGFIKQVIYKLDRHKFRKGMAKSVKMSSRFADRAGRVNGRKFRIHEIRPSFELSIGGDFKLVSIAGLANLEMSFYNWNF